MPYSKEKQKEYWHLRYCEYLKFVNDYKLKLGCKDCGYNKNAAGLEFDHLPQYKKSYTISKMVGKFSKEQILEEIAKCDVVCGTCHGIRTFERSKVYTVWKRLYG